MIFKRLIILMLLNTVVGCASMYSLTDGDSNTQTEAQLNAKASDSEHLDVITEPIKPEALSPDEQLALSLIEQSDLYWASKRALSPDTKNKVIVVLNNFNNGEFEQSEKSINEILATELNLNSAVYVLAGDIALANKKTSDAIAHFNAALTLNQYDAKAANRLAMQQREQGNFVLAEKLYTQAIHAQASHAESYRNRAVLYDLYLNQKADALYDYQIYSALLNYRLAMHEHQEKSNLSQINVAPEKALAMSDSQLITTKRNIKLAKRWLVDVGRQVAALTKLESNNTGGT